MQRWKVSTPVWDVVGESIMGACVRRGSRGKCRPVSKLHATAAGSRRHGRCGDRTPQPAHSAGRKEPAVDAVQFLHEEHQKVRERFAAIEAAPGAQRQQLWQQLEPELKIHEEIEDTYL